MTGTISSLTYTPTSITVIDGQVGTVEFPVPTDTVDTSNGVTSSLCGTKTYVITDELAATITTWAAITASSDGSNVGGKTLTIDTTTRPAQYTPAIPAGGSIVKTLTITTTFADWPVASGGPAGSTSTIAVTL